MFFDLTTIIAATPRNNFEETKCGSKNNTLDSQFLGKTRGEYFNFKTNQEGCLKMQGHFFQQ